MRPPQAVPPRPEIRWGRSGCLALAGAGLAFLLLVLAVTSWRTVDTGKVAVTRQFREITGTQLAGGFFTNPIGFSMVEYDLRVAKRLTKKQAALRNQQTLYVNDVAYQYNLTPDAARLLLETVGTQDTFETNVVIPKLENAIKQTTPNYTADQVFPKRPEMEAEMERRLAADLAEYKVVPTSVDITLADFDFDPNFRASIDAKAKAEQEKQVELANLDKQRTQNERQLLQAKTDAEQAVQKAIGEANSARERAAGEAAAIGLRAAAEAKANQQIRASLDTALINYQYAQNWNGQLPSTVLGGNGTNAFIGLPGATTTTSPQPTAAPRRTGSINGGGNGTP